MDATQPLEVGMDTNLAALIAAVAASVAVCAHGVVGHRWFTAQLRSVDMGPTPVSTRLFGDRDVSWRVFGLTWHIVTSVFLVSAGALYLTAFGAIESRDLLRFIAILHVTFLAVGLFYADKSLDALRQPIPALFFSVMVAAAALAWVASNEV